MFSSLTLPEIHEKLGLSPSDLRYTTHDELINLLDQEIDRIHIKKQELSPSKRQNISNQNNLTAKNSKNNSPKNNKTPIQSSGYDSDPEYDRKQIFESQIKKTLTPKYSKTKKFHFTVPKPFSFLNKTNEKITISKMKFLEDQEERKRNEQEIINSKFKAKSVPESVKPGLFNKITLENQSRREQVKKNSIAITLQREKPFKFYIRDKEKSKIKKKNNYERKVFLFKASPIPWFCSIPLLENMTMEENAKRQERIASYAQKALSLAKLPPRMEKHQQMKKIERAYEMNNPKKNKNYNQNLIFQPHKHKKIPDFQTLQENFQILLDNKRNNKRPTVPIPFSFENSKKNTDYSYLNEKNTNVKIDPIKKWEKIKGKISVKQPAGTLKWVQACEKRKIDAENNERNKKLKEIEWKNKQDLIVKEMKSRVQNSPAIVNNDKALEERRKTNIKALKEGIKKTETEYMIYLDNLKEKIRNKPLLVEDYERKKVIKEKNKIIEIQKNKETIEEKKKYEKNEQIKFIDKQKNKETIEEENEYEKEGFES